MEVELSAGRRQRRCYGCEIENEARGSTVPALTGRLQQTSAPGAYTGGGGGGFTVANETPRRSFKFRFKINGMRAHCVRAPFSRSIPAVFLLSSHAHATRSFNFQACMIVAERARPCSGRRVMRCLGAVRVSHILVQNGEHGFCSIRRHDEEKSFNGHSFSLLNEERRVLSHRFSGRLAYGEGQ